MSPRAAIALILAGSIAAAGIGYGSAGWNLLPRIEGMTIDWRFQSRGPQPSRTKIVIVEIDEVSRRSLKHDGLAFNLREHLTPAINRLADAGALVVGLDIWLADRTSEEVDQQLAATIAEANVVLAAVYTDPYYIRAAEVLRSSSPVEGLISVDLDAGDNVLRRTPRGLFLNLLSDNNVDVNKRIPHFPLAVSLFRVLEDNDHASIEFSGDTARVGGHSLRAGELVDWIAVKRGMANESAGWPTITFAEAVTGAFDPAIVDGALVLIGEASMLQDSFLTPLSKEVTPGVYYHANVIAQILEDRHFNERWSSPELSRRVAAGLALAAALLALFPLARRRSKSNPLVEWTWTLVTAAVFLAGWTLLCFRSFDEHVLLPMSGPLLAMALALLIGFGAQWIKVSAEARRLEQRARQIERLFSRSVSQSVLNAIKQNPEQIARTEVREVTVLFCDLRDYTRTTSEMQPLEAARMLNEYYSHVTTAVFENDGFLDKFVGDAMMAVFSAPIEQPDHVERALRTAMTVKSRLAELNRLRQQRGETPLACGFGIHTGPAALGHVGSAERSNYTVIGTTVNLSSRIEGHSRQGEILVSRAVRDRLGDRVRMRHFSTVELRGAAGQHELYQVETDN